MKSTKKIVFILLSLLCLIMFGCDSATNPTNSNSPINNGGNTGTEKGYFVDAPVSGLAYKTSSGITGVTDEKGAYNYNPGDTITFLLGEAQLGNEVSAAAVVTPCTLTGATSISEETPEAKEALNMAKIFLALDTDGSDFGLSLDKNVTTENLTTENLENILKSENFSNDVKSIIGNATIPTDEEATSHYNVVAGQIDGEENLENHNSLVTKLQQYMEWCPKHSIFFACRLPEGIQTLYTTYTHENDYRETLGLSNPYIDGQVEYVEAFLGYKEDPEECPDCSYFGYNPCRCVKDGNYRVMMIARQSESAISEGDVICYYDGFGFQQTKPENYPFVVDNSKKNIIYVDFTSDKHNAVVKDVYKISGTITVNCDTEKFEQSGIAEGKTLKSLPFTFYLSDSDDMSIPLNLTYNTKEVKGNTTVYTYETTVLPTTTRIQADYSPFDDWSVQGSDSKYDLNLTGDTEINFEIAYDFFTALDSFSDEYGEWERLYSVDGLEGEYENIENFQNENGEPLPADILKLTIDETNVTIKAFIDYNEYLEWAVQQEWFVSKEEAWEEWYGDSYLKDIGYKKTDMDYVFEANNLAYEGVRSDFEMLLEECNLYKDTSGMLRLINFGSISDYIYYDHIFTKQ